jgi:catechol 2,3-dioxygenase-like lactoylglutathione lyase family enzyme
MGRRLKKRKQFRLPWCGWQGFAPLRSWRAARSTVDLIGDPDRVPSSNRLAPDPRNRKASSLKMPEVQRAPKLDHLHHVAVSVSNLKQTVDWYLKHFDCQITYQDETWAIVKFANVSLAFVLPEQHPPHIAVLGDPNEYGQPVRHRDGTHSVYVKDPAGNNVEILALE